MALQTIWWICIIGAVGSVLYNLVIHRRYRRRGEPLPWHHAGNVAGGLSLILLMTAQLVIDHVLWFSMALAGSVLLLAVDFAQYRTARRRQLT